jgi:hypothetical protein
MSKGCQVRDQSRTRFDEKIFFLLVIKIFFLNLLYDNSSVKFIFFILEKKFFF